VVPCGWNCCRAVSARRIRYRRQLSASAAEPRRQIRAKPPERNVRIST
jgi:hypothetical protein